MSAGAWNDQRWVARNAGMRKTPRVGTAAAAAGPATGAAAKQYLQAHAEDVFSVNMAFCLFIGLKACPPEGVYPIVHPVGAPVLCVSCCVVGE